MLYCDTKTGLCGTDTSDPETEWTTLPTAPQGHIWFVTDPICSHCWATEPAWRKLLFHYGRFVTVRYIYGGLLPGWEGFADPGANIYQPADVASHWVAVSNHYGQPINPEVWLRDPLSSSYPPSIAAKAVCLLDAEKEEAFLRRLREALFVDALNITREEVLMDCAAGVRLDPHLFLTLYHSQTAQQAFQRDMEETRRLPVRGFPTLIIQGQDQQALVLHGTQPYDQLEKALLQVTGLPRSQHQPSLAEVMQVYGTGTTQELAEVLDLPVQETAELLQTTPAHAKPVAHSIFWSFNHG